MIKQDSEFRQALSALSRLQQRQIGSQFIERVLPQYPDATLSKLLALAQQTDAAELELAAAAKTAKSLALDKHTRCGAEGDWQAQASYFLARATSELFAPSKPSQLPAWEAALNVRLACTCGSIEQAHDTMHDESAAQYQLLTDYLAREESRHD